MAAPNVRFFDTATKQALYKLLDRMRVAIDAAAGGGSFAGKLAYLTTTPTNFADSSTTVLGSLASFVMPAGTQTANRTKTIDPTGLVDGARVRVQDLDVGQWTLAIANGGPGGGTLWTFPAFQGGDILLKYSASTGDLSLAEGENVPPFDTLPVANYLALRTTAGILRALGFEVDTDATGATKAFDITLAGGRVSVQSYAAGAAAGMTVKATGAPMILDGTAGGGNLGVVTNSGHEVGGDFRSDTRHSRRHVIGGTSTGAFNVDTSASDYYQTPTLTGDITITFTNMLAATWKQSFQLEIVCHKSAGRTCAFAAITWPLEVPDAQAAFDAAIASASVERVILDCEVRGGAVFARHFDSYAT